MTAGSAAAAEHGQARRRPSGVTLIVGGLTAYLALYLCWLLFRWGGPQHTVLISDLAFLPMAAAAMLFARRAANHPALDAQTRRAWLRLSLAFASLWLGDTLWLVYDAIVKERPFPSWADFGFLLYYPVMLWALLSFRRERRSHTERVTFWLDTATVLVGAGMVAWHFVLRPTALLPNESTLKTTLALAYPIGDLILMLGIVTVLWRGAVGVTRRPLLLLIAGLGVQVVYDLAFAYLNLRNLYQTGDWPDALWMTTRWIMMLSGVAQWHIAERVRHAGLARPSASLAHQARLAPYIAVTVAFGLLLVVGRDQMRGSLGGLLLGAVTLTALVVFRQIIAQRDYSRLAAEQAARRNEARFRSLVQQSSDVFMIVDADGVIRYVSPAAERIFGYHPDALVGTRLASLLRPDQTDWAAAFLHEVGRHLGSSPPIEWWVRCSDGSWRYVETIAMNLLSDPDVGGIVLNSRDISDRKALEEELKRQAFQDPLTSLANRVLLHDRLEHALARGQQSGVAVALLFLDLDNFKTINDSLGHAAGDEVLLTVAARLKELATASDTVARFGGDEFVLLIEDAHDHEYMQALAERVLRSLAAGCHVGGKDVTLQASIGLALAPPGAVTADNLLRNADVAMYHAKGSGKNRYAVFNPSMHAAALARLELEADLRRAVEQEEFELFYQPSISVENGEIAGVEALIRWNHPYKGRVSPAEFIAVAEETGLIVPVGRWILRRACLQAKQWRDRYPSVVPFSMKVNLSVRQLAEPGLVEDVAQVLRQTGFDPRALVLEITESVMMTNTEATIDKLRALKELGVLLAVDDFGTGYSSLSYLQRFPIDILKVDKSFVDDLGRAEGNDALAQAIIKLGKTLELTTIAEGVESLAQFDQLRFLGCTEAQGYYFAKPMDAAGIDTLLRKAEEWRSLTRKVS